MLKSITVNILSLILSFIILFIYNLNIYDNNILSIKELILNNYVLLFYVFIISVISQYFYENDLSYKRRSKSIFSLNIFKLISKFIHVSSIVIVVNSLLIDNFFNLDFHNSINYRFIGVSFSAIAISLFISSKISLGANYSPCYDQRNPKYINKSGLYKYVRHPMYSSNILLLIGILIISGSYLMFINITLLTVFYVISAFKEEKYLMNKFSSYEKYSEKTGMFIPKYWK